MPSKPLQTHNNKAEEEEQVVHAVVTTPTTTTPTTSNTAKAKTSFVIPATILNKHNNDDDDYSDEEDEAEEPNEKEDVTASIDLALTTFYAIASPLSVPSTFTTTTATPTFPNNDDDNNKNQPNNNNITSFSKPPTPPHTNVTKCYFSPYSYRERLVTFGNPVNYFAKPNMLSPLVCARFGWINKSKDMLQCTHPKCRATICITFHPLLSPKARFRLACTYRKMLATSHLENHCPFRNDAERWLDGGVGVGGGMDVFVLDSSSSGRAATGKKKKKPANEQTMEPKKKRNDTTSNVIITTNKKDNIIVPPYLLPMAKEFQIFEDSSYNHDVTKRFIWDHALKLDENVLVPSSFLTTNEDKKGKDDRDLFWKKWCIVVPKEVMDWYSSQFLKEGGGVSLVGNDENGAIGGKDLAVAKSLSLRIGNAILSCVVDDDGSDDCSSEEEEEEEENKKAADRPSDMSAVLATFGWSPLKNDHTSNQTTPTKMSLQKCVTNDDGNTGHCVAVQCQICLARALIFLHNVKKESEVKEKDCGDCHVVVVKEGVGQSSASADDNTEKQQQQQQNGKRKRDQNEEKNDNINPFIGEKTIDTSNIQPSPKKKVQRIDDSSTSVDTSNKQPTQKSPTRIMIHQEGKSSSRKEFNVVNSHRFFCPYACGFDNGRASDDNFSTPKNGDKELPQEQKPGWEIILENLLCDNNRHDNEEALIKMKQHQFTGSNVGGKGDMAFHLIESMLRGSDFY